jgi:DNA-binding beta-propeller fold protein YncE
MGVNSGIAVDSADRVYVVDREPEPAIVVFDREGRFLTSWGEDLFPLPHEIWISPDDRLFITDCRDHSVRICTTEGKVLQTLGNPGNIGAPGEPFNMPTRAVQAPSGDIFVSDGYGQQFVHCFSSDGTWKHSWGGKGSQPGQFTLPHNIFITPDERVAVADREPNNRLQFFDFDGGFLEQWPGRLYPCGLFIDPDGAVFVAEGGGVSLFSPGGRLMSQFVVTGGPDDRPHGAHSLWVDRHGDLYVGEVGVENLVFKYTRV